MSTFDSWAYLRTVIDGPSPHLQALFRAGRDADEIARGLRTRASWLGGLLGDTEHTRNLNPHEMLEKASLAGFALIHPDSPEWPAEEIDGSFDFLSVSDSVSSASTKELTKPHGLWVSGNQDLRTLVAQSVGIVGTRNATDYGRKATATLCAELARHNYTVVSGGALGIDTVAHRAALEHQLPTVAIMAGGPGWIYPLRNKELFSTITQRGGALVSEYSPGSQSYRWRFLERNRLIAALTPGTVVVEAPYRSGALNTMTRVNDFGRLPMAMPGPIQGLGQSDGCNQLIKRNEAMPVTDVRDVHQYLCSIGTVDVENQLELEYAPSQVQALSRNELRVYDALNPLGDKGITCTEVAEKAGLTTALTVHLLVDLVKRNVVTRDGEHWARMI